MALSKCSCHVLHSTENLVACFAGVRLVHFSPARCLALLCATGIARLTAGQLNLSVTHTYLHVSCASIPVQVYTCVPEPALFSPSRHRPVQTQRQSL